MALVQDCGNFCDIKSYIFALQATSKVEIDPDATDKLQICPEDFMHALAHDVKPVSQWFGTWSAAIICKISSAELTHCGLVTPYGNLDLGQHWLW